MVLFHYMYIKAVLTMIHDIVLVRCSRTIDKMWTVASLLVIFVLLNFSKAFKSVKDMKWKKDPSISAWGESAVNKNYVPFDQRSVLLILNVANYTKNTEKTFIATGVLLDNSRILTSYNPFEEFINEAKYTDNIVVVLATGTHNFTIHSVEIQDVIVCGRQIAFAGTEVNFMNTPSPIHDLMVLRMAEEIGIATRSYDFEMNWAASHRQTGAFVWGGQIFERNSLISLLAAPGEQILGPLWICSLEFTVEKGEEVYETIATYTYDEEDSVLVDCEEWLPRHWGYFICIRNIYNLSGLASGSTLFTKRKLFGIGSFAMFKNDTGILVFTDVRPYVDLIMQTCGDDEFT